MQIGKGKHKKTRGGRRMCREINNWWQMMKWNRRREGSKVRKKGKTGRRSEGRERGKWRQGGGRDAEDGGRGQEASSSHLFVRASRTMMGGKTERWEERCQSRVTKCRVRICISEGFGGLQTGRGWGRRNPTCKRLFTCCITVTKLHIVCRDFVHFAS